MLKKGLLLIPVFLLLLTLGLVGCDDAPEEPTAVDDSVDADMDSAPGENGDAADESLDMPVIEDEYVFRIVHEEIPGSIQDAYCQEFKRLIEERSGGQIEVIVYAVGEIGVGVEVTELLQTGGVEFTTVSPGNTGTIIPETQLFYLHFLLSDDMHTNTEILQTSKAIEMLNELYMERGLQVLDWWHQGPMVWSANRAIRTPDDFTGFKMRTMQTPLIVESYRQYGANPTPVPYTEVYSGLQLGMVEGQENPIINVEEMKWYEVQDYVINSRHALYVVSTVVNPDFYASLPPEVASLIDEVVAELNPYSFQVQEEYNQRAREIIKDHLEIIDLTEEQRQAFREAAFPVRDFYVQQIGTRGEEILNLLVEEVLALEGAGQ